MSRLFTFVREKAFMLILLGSIIAAAGTGIWAIRTIQQNLSRTTPNSSTAEEFGGFAQNEPGEDALWNAPAELVTDEMNGEIAMEEPDELSGEDTAQSTNGQAVQNTPSPSSTPSSSASSSPEPSEASAILEPQEIMVKPSFVLPVSGLVCGVFSGDELVYNETLGDWRTHNGIDYAAELGETVICPTKGTVSEIRQDGNWGGVVEILDDAGYTWRFCGVENSPLAAGDSVAITDPLGCVGIISAESALEPHLHVEILSADGLYQDPSEHFK